MKAIRFHHHGGPEVLRFEDAPDPSAGPGEVLIGVKATSLNHLDLWIRKGLPGLSVGLPHIPGCDAAGVVKAVGAGVTNVRPGDAVLINPGSSCGRCEFCLHGEESLCLRYTIVGEHRAGACAELLAVPAATVFPLPKGLSFEEGAAFPLVYLTAWRMVVGKGDVRPGQDVLIHAVGAGVGIASLQIAKSIGARVIVTASSDDKLRRARELGADATIHNRNEDVEKRVKEITARRGADVVIDYIAGPTWATSLRCARRGGRIVTCGATGGYEPKMPMAHVFYRQLQILGATMGSAAEFRSLYASVAHGRLKPVIDRVLPLEKTGEGEEALEKREVFGKVVIKV